MFVRCYDVVFALVGLWLCAIFSNASEECDPGSCLGPLYYYEEIGCTPIFENTTSCCPTSYNCDLWKNVTSDQCWVEGRVYNNFEALPARFAPDPCMECLCFGDRFSCVMSMCGGPLNEKPGCRYLPTLLRCCAYYEICEDSPIVCNVDGKSYKVGESFTPVDEPSKTCYCEQGYDGVNDERFCVWRKPSWCYNVINDIGKIRNNCAPIYRKNAVLYKDCNEDHLCHGNYGIENIPNNDTTASSTVESMGPVKQCKLGNLTMNIGDKLHATRHWGGTVSCVCEIPPVPTCFSEDWQ